MPKIKFVCNTCKRDFWEYPSQRDSRPGVAVYCSHKCRETGKTGSLSKGWKGGKYIATSGYAMIHKPEHPRSLGGYVPEHILVAAEKMNRPITKNEHVHHINGDRADNRPENLIVISPSAHTTIHWSGRSHSPQSRAKMTESRKGRKLSEDTKAKLSAIFRGRKVSEETREKMRAAYKPRDYTPSPEARAKMSAAAKRRSRDHSGKYLSEQ